jgi:hypothetical protein
MLRRIAPLALVAAALLPAGSASAIKIGVGPTGGITVYPNLAACATLDTTHPITAVGTFTSAGAVNGPGTAVGVVRGALPVTFVNSTHWYGCLPDAYAGATIGYAKYTLTLSGATDDYVEILQCTVTSGAVSCV